MEYLIWLMAGAVLLFAFAVWRAAYRLHMTNDATDGPCVIHRLLHRRRWRRLVMSMGNAKSAIQDLANAFRDFRVVIDAVKEALGADQPPRSRPR